MTAAIGLEVEVPAQDEGIVLREAAPLSPLEVAVIDLFQSAMKMLGIPRTVGEIYGLLFTSAHPLSLDALTRRLRLSKGSVSQGLKLLRAVGAVRAVYVAGDRRDHYSAEVELKRLAVGFMREEVQPRLESGQERLTHLRGLLEDLDVADPDAGFLRERVSKLGTWHERAQELLPLLTTVLE